MDTALYAMRDEVIIHQISKKHLVQNSQNLNVNGHKQAGEHVNKYISMS